MVDAMPQWVPAMLAKLSGSLPKDDARWAYEMKWDGIRALAFIQAGKLRIMTRNQIEVTKRYPELLPLSSQLGYRNAILDGEIVGFNDQGRPSFEALQQRMELEGRQAGSESAGCRCGVHGVLPAPSGRQLPASGSL